MTTPNTENIFQQLYRIGVYKDVTSSSINPTISRDTNTYLNQQANVDPSTASKDYSWSWRYFGYQDTISNLTLNNDVLKNSPSRIYFKEIYSDNGNLTVFDVLPNTLSVYSALIYKKYGSSTKFTLNWSGSLNIFVNSTSIITNDNAPFESQEVPFYLGSGWNSIDIFLYAKTPGQYFSINNTIGDFADDWGTPIFDAPDTPKNVSVTIDQNLNGKRDPHTNILRWDQTDPNTTFAYNLYRRGPYNSGLQPPVIDISSSSGYFVSGASGVRNPYLLSGYPSPATYVVSARTSNGESLPSRHIKLTQDPYFSGTVFSGTIQSLVGAGLATGFYEYALLTNSVAGSLISQAQPIFPVLGAGSGISFTWVTQPNILSYSLIRSYNSGLWFNVNNINGYAFSGTPINAIEVANIGPTTSTYFDTGFAGTVKQFYFAKKENLNNIIFTNDTAYINNSYKLSWAPSVTLETGLITYSVYRTFYSGNFEKNSLVTTTTGTTFIDSGYPDPTLGKPTNFENLTQVDWGNTKYKDVGVIPSQYYDYRVASINYSLNEGFPSSFVSIRGGDEIPPNTPSGITITSFNGFVTLGWQNGIEPDLAGTNIYKSELSSGPYSIIGNTDGTTFSTFVGYSGSPYFKLSNFDTSENESSLSSAFQGSGVLVAENIIMKKFDILSTADIDMDYYVYSGLYTSSSSPFRSTLVPEYYRNVSVISFWSAWLDNSNNNSLRVNSINQDSLLENYTLDIVPDKLSGISATVFSTSNNPKALGTKLIATYYTGTQNSNYFLHYRAYNKDNSTSFSQIATSTTGINVGTILVNSLDPSFTGPTNTLSNLTRPKIISSYSNVDKNVIVFLSGDTINAAFGFVALNRSGIITGVIKYLPVLNNDIFPLDFDACFDISGYIHTTWRGAGSRPCDIYWQKLDFNNENISPITILDSGKYFRGGAIGGGGFVFDSGEVSKFPLYYPRITTDINNEVSLFFRENGDNGRFITYSKLNSDGTLKLSPNMLYQIPFQFDPNSWNVGYASGNDTIYSNYNMPSYYLSGLRNLSYNYKEGSYRRRHEFERFNNSSMYQILQSLLK